MSEERVGLIGVRSFVGERLSFLLDEKGYQTICFSRQGGKGTVSLAAPVEDNVDKIKKWVCVAPIWTLPEHFQLLEKYGATRLVAVSSTSRFTKIESRSVSDREVARQLIEGEEKVLQWAESQGVDTVILQSTLIYGRGKDKNVTQIAQFIRKFGFFPLLGKGNGLRQPVHVDDLAAGCCSALEKPEIRTNTYILSGGEVLSYRAMVERIFAALGRKPRFLRCPLVVFSLAIRLANLLPSFKELSTEMAVRMNRDQNFDHAEAADALGFRPRPFHLQNSDFSTTC